MHILKWMKTFLRSSYTPPSICLFVYVYLDQLALRSFGSVVVVYIVVYGYKSDKKKTCYSRCFAGQPSRPFIIYINNITTNIESDILIFADDT